jgi:formylglycine-generating enzyme required for sulfatase activity
MPFHTRVALSAAAWLWLTSHTLAVTFETVVVGDVHNVGELTGAGAGGFGNDAIVGAVSYSYRIATFEVTNAQYVEFLNAKAASDPLAFYALPMGSSLRGGISRTGTEGNYHYEARPNMADKPVNYVNRYDAMRFVNWLHNGQGSGDTETGTYTLLGNTDRPSNFTSIARNTNARWFLPSESEWYKAAYFDPSLNGGGGGYYDFAGRSDVAPEQASAGALGDVTNPGANVANYLNGASWGGAIGNLTSVGGAGPASTSYYGTFDQNGNVWEWNEEVDPDGGRWGARGGGWANGLDALRASGRNFFGGMTEADDLGFRVASVPEPNGIVLLTTLFVAACLWRITADGTDEG